MRIAPHKKCDLVYCCHAYLASCIALWFFTDGLHALGLLDFGVLQIVGQLIGLVIWIPLTLGALAAIALGSVMSLMLYRKWWTERGLVILPAVFGLVVASFFLDARAAGGDYWIYFATTLYVPGALFFSRRWYFLRSDQQNPWS